MNLLEWLQAGDSSFAIVGGLLAAPYFLWRARRSAIASHYTDLAQDWTNEGAIGSAEPMFVHMSLKLERGELSGSIRSSLLAEELDVNVTPGWFWSTANITLLQGRSVFTVAIVRLRLRGNRNRLVWDATTLHTPNVLPRRIELWPSPVPYEQLLSSPKRGA